MTSETRMGKGQQFLPGAHLGLADAMLWGSPGVSWRGQQAEEPKARISLAAMLTNRGGD